MKNILAVIVSSLLLVVGASAQFQFFEQMFQGGGGGQQQQERGRHDGPSDSQWYQDRYGDAHCSKYLCPDTLACVSFPHHCPCPHPAVEEKFELQEGRAICISKGGYQLGEAAKKVELARKGLI